MNNDEQVLTLKKKLDRQYEAMTDDKQKDFFKRYALEILSLNEKPHNWSPFKWAVLSKYSSIYTKLSKEFGDDIGEENKKEIDSALSKLLKIESIENSIDSDFAIDSIEKSQKAILNVKSNIEMMTDQYPKDVKSIVDKVGNNPLHLIAEFLEGNSFSNISQDRPEESIKKIEEIIEEKKVLVSSFLNKQDNSATPKLTS